MPYFCSSSDVESETDSYSDSNYTDEERTADSETADDVESEINKKASTK